MFFKIYYVIFSANGKNCGKAIIRFDATKPSLLDGTEVECLRAGVGVLEQFLAQIIEIYAKIFLKLT